MAPKPAKSFVDVLQSSITPDDNEWRYTVRKLPTPDLTDTQNLIKSIAVVSNSQKQTITLKFENASRSRITASEQLHHLMVISFADFHLRYPEQTRIDKKGQRTHAATARESGEYIVRLLRSGITLNGVVYHFYGHSNSQLKSKTCFLFAGTKDEISRKVEALGDFSKLKSVAKKAKRIGLLFSTAEMATLLQPERCEDISDIETKEYNFTDGCGLISPRLADLLVKQVHIAFRNRRYTPSVFQIRYRGYKGVLTLDPAMEGKIQAKFRASMKKFSEKPSGVQDLSFSVVNYSKPYTYGFLNDEVILLLHSLGIADDVLLRKQHEHFQLLSEATQYSHVAFRFLSYVNRLDIAEKVIMDGIESCRPTIRKLVNQEYDKTLNKREEVKCRILVPNSRLLYGVCDPTDVLREGECAVKVTMDGDGQPRTVTGIEVLVTRNPCLHPGDLQKFKVVERPELSHLVDCIVFSTRGKRPSADMMSGGDLDGDTFFVCWDRDLIPAKLSQPAEYPGGKEPVKFNAITDDDRLEYFARYTNASLGRVKNLFLDWARLKGPMSAECQQLNRLFSSCVDGNRIRVPDILESPPKPPEGTPGLVTDILHDAAKVLIKKQQKDDYSFDGYTYGALELLLARDDIAISEFDLLKLTYRWCIKSRTDLTDFFHLFDFEQLSHEEKIWVMSVVPPSAGISSLILNGLLQSNLLQNSELHPFKLHYPGLRWKCTYDSARDRLGTFLDATSKALELFHKKLIVVRVDERLSLAIYVPQKIEKRRECQVDDKVRLFTFPHSQGTNSAGQRVVPTKKDYRLYCDDTNFQLYENKRANTWVFFTRSATDDSKYRHIEDRGDRRREKQKTLDKGVNYDYRASIALNKFKDGNGLQKHVGRVNRNGILAAEIYVISNRDIRAQRTLDLWLEFVDTREIIPLFERTAREYHVSTIANTDWTLEPPWMKSIVKDSNLDMLNELESITEYIYLFRWLHSRREFRILENLFLHLLHQASTGLISAMLEFLEVAPTLAITFARVESWNQLRNETAEFLMNNTFNILKALILAANQRQELVVEPFKKVLSYTSHISSSMLQELVETITLTVQNIDVALDLLLEALEPEALRILTGRPKANRYFIRSLLGIALDHIDEANESRAKKSQLLDLTFGKKETSKWVLSSRLRIDAPFSGLLATSDHVRLTTASSPANAVTQRAYTMDALVVASAPGSVSFRCLHPPPSYVEECSWKIHNCGSFVTAKTMFDALGRLATEQELCCAIYEPLLDLSSHGTPANVQENPARKSREDLNASQNEALKASLVSPLTCLWGPPGTGKTHTVVAILQELLAAQPDQRILVAAPTHNAVDNVMRKFISEMHVMKGTDIAHVVPLRVSTDVRKVANDIKKHTIDALLNVELQGNFSALKKAQKRIRDSRLVFTTCIGAGLGLLRSEAFEIVIIDEASQQTEPASLVPLVKGCKKAILVGDHVQLRATVGEHAVLQDYDVSLFERLYHNSSRDPRRRKVMLDTQYRMHPQICSFSSREFYESKLSTGIPVSARLLPPSTFPWPLQESRIKGAADVDKSRLVFIQCSTPEDLGQKSKSNSGQATLCAQICKMLLTPASPSTSTHIESLQPPPTIAILTPYSRQVELLKRTLPSGVEVASIDGFQGREADLVVFVTVRCNVHCEIGFLKDLRRLNVAMTRAKLGVIVIGDEATLTGRRVGDDEVDQSKQVWKGLCEKMKTVVLPS